jgi:hypothetical protein
MDGLVVACKIALDTGRAPQRHGSAPHVTVLVHDETLAQAPGAPPAQTGHGQALTARQVLAMCCAAQVSAIRWADGLPLDVGRASRTEPIGLRRALEARDRGCRWPGCDALAAWCTAHHIYGWRDGAGTALHELVLLCHVHHAYFIHQLGWGITGDPNGMLRFTHPADIVTLDSPLPAAGQSAARTPTGDGTPAGDGPPAGHRTSAGDGTLTGDRTPPTTTHRPATSDQRPARACDLKLTANRLQVLIVGT